MSRRVRVMAALALGCLVAAPVRADDDEREALARARQEQAALVALVARCSPAFVAVGGGSAVCIRADGLIVTNHHVAGDREQWAVYFGDGRPALKAKRLGADARGDLCFLKVEGEHSDLPFLPLGDSSRVVPGQRVFALGNPWLLSQDGRPTVTFGIVSALHHNQGGYTDAIMTDTAVNPGNSGGPLITLGGEVIGINGRIMTRFAGVRVNTGIGVAIPSNQIRNFFEPLSTAKPVWHGELASVFVAAAERPVLGVRVTDIYTSSPAYRAGLRYDDIVTAVGGVPVRTRSQFDGILGTHPAGSVVTLDVTRIDADLDLGEPIPDDVATSRHAIAVRLASVEPVRHGIEFAVGSGDDAPYTTTVERVEPGGPAWCAGLRPGDRITHVDGEPLAEARQFASVWRYGYPGKRIVLAIERGGIAMLRTIELTGVQPE